MWQEWFGGEKGKGVCHVCAYISGQNHLEEAGSQKSWSLSVKPTPIASRCMNSHSPGRGFIYFVFSYSGAYHGFCARCLCKIAHVWPIMRRATGLIAHAI